MAVPMECMGERRKAPPFGRQKNTDQDHAAVPPILHTEGGFFIRRPPTNGS